VFRIELSDPSRLAELHDFYVTVQAVARINGKGPVSAELRQEQTGFEP
jgi:hypothetical protein